nr:immunoglobulin heavy chain junction region [Macaca mulatta]
CTRQDSNLDYW